MQTQPALHADPDRARPGLMLASITGGRAARSIGAFYVVRGVLVALAMAALPFARQADVAAAGSGPAASAAGPFGRVTVPEAPRAAARLDVARDVPALPGASVGVSITFDTGGNDVASLAYSLDIDEQWLSFDPTDSNLDGLPDAIAISVPRGLRGSASYDAADTDGELDILIYDGVPPLSTFTSGTIMTVTFTAGQPATTTLAAVAFSTNPVPSAGSNLGQGVALTATGGSVVIQGTGVFPTSTPSAEASPSASPAGGTTTPTATPTPPTEVPAATATATGAPSLAPTSTWTPTSEPSATVTSTIPPSATPTFFPTPTPADIPELTPPTPTRTATPPPPRATPTATLTRVASTATRTPSPRPTRWRIYLSNVVKRW